MTLYPDRPQRDLLVLNDLDVGLGPPRSRVGDVLCLLAGYDMPVILRPVEDHYQFVGNAVGPGVMYGEALLDHELSVDFEIR